MSDSSTTSAPAGQQVSDADQRVLETVLRRIADDLSLVIDRPLTLEQPECKRLTKRVAGRGRVHISFKIAFTRGSQVRYGCLLVPLPDAIAVACYLMMVPDEGVRGRRGAVELDKATKDAMVEVDNFIGGATDAALRSLCRDGQSARGAGCQGVRADVRPAFPYTEGDELLVARVRAKLHHFDPFELTLITPVIENVDLD
jgi:hypothetical protein